MVLSLVLIKYINQGTMQVKDVTKNKAGSKTNHTDIKRIRHIQLEKKINKIKQTGLQFS